MKETNKIIPETANREAEHTTADLFGLKNLYFWGVDEGKSESQFKIKFKEFGLDDIEKFTIVYYSNAFKPQGMTFTEFPDPFKMDLYNYYIMRYNKIFMTNDLYNFISERPEEKFLLCDADQVGYPMNISVFINNEETNKLKITFFTTFEDGRYHKLAEVNNIPNTPIWNKEPIIYMPEIVDGIIYEEESTYDHTYKWNIRLKDLSSNSSMSTEKFGYYDHMNRSSFYIIGENSSFGSRNSDEILNQFLNLDNMTRILSNFERYAEKPYFSVSIGDKCMEDEINRYGIPVEDAREGFNGFHIDEPFPEADLDIETKKRVENEIRDILLLGKGKKFNGDYRRRATYEYTAKIVISAPVGNHRRPTYHYIEGFKRDNAIDIVELARGELLIKDMIPASVYYLCANGQYIRLSHRKFGETKNMIIEDGVIDQQTFFVWSEEKSLHPDLLKTVLRYQDELGLDVIKKFNRLPFGALLIEQLLKEGKYQFGSQLTTYINDRADNINYLCNSLDDLFPECNPMGSSVLKIFDMNKTAYEFLNDMATSYSGSSFSTTTTTVESFITAYKAIKALCPSGVLTKNDKELIEKYMFLYNANKACINTSRDTKVDIINYPEGIKSLYKMIHKINDKFRGNPNKRNVKRMYDEIVTAYFSFLDYGWNPEDHKIFIEFSINGDPDQVCEEIHSREHAANTAFSIYQNKINEAKRKVTEEKYASRESALRKLETVDMKEKDMTNLSRKYVIMKPSQIYGEDVIGSVEKEGADMHHCVYRQYANEIANGTYTVLYLRLREKPEESLVTIGITKEGRINQTYAIDDRPINTEQAAAIVEWAVSKKELVDFHSENSLVTPSGWPGVGLPDLPAPNREWLKKLAKVTYKTKI